jgi:CheY-like chemotaxis protein
MRLALERSGLPNSLAITVDGIEAIDYLAGNGIYANRDEHPFPCLVLLDLKLPRKDGFEVLAWIRQDPRLATLPVVAYSSSQNNADRNKTLGLGATDYVVKMSNVDDIATWLRTLASLCRQEA